MVTKRCVWGDCKSDSRYKDRPHMQGVFFIPFPKPRLNDATRRKCLRWINVCGRPNDQLNVNLISTHHFICSKHFVGENGPTDCYPDPLPAKNVTRRHGRGSVIQISGTRNRPIVSSQEPSPRREFVQDSDSFMPQVSRVFDHNEAGQVLLSLSRQGNDSCGNGVLQRAPMQQKVPKVTSVSQSTRNRRKRQLFMTKQQAFSPSSVVKKIHDSVPVEIVRPNLTGWNSDLKGHLGSIVRPSHNVQKSGRSETGAASTKVHPDANSLTTFITALGANSVVSTATNAPKNTSLVPVFLGVPEFVQHTTTNQSTLPHTQMNSIQIPVVLNAAANIQQLTGEISEGVSRANSSENMLAQFSLSRNPTAAVRLPEYSTVISMGSSTNNASTSADGSFIASNVHQTDESSATAGVSTCLQTLKSGEFLNSSHTALSKELRCSVNNKNAEHRDQEYTRRSGIIQNFEEQNRAVIDTRQDLSHKSVILQMSPSDIIGSDREVTSRTKINQSLGSQNISGTSPNLDFQSHDVQAIESVITAQPSNKLRNPEEEKQAMATENCGFTEIESRSMPRQSILAHIPTDDGQVSQEENRRMQETDARTHSSKPLLSTQCKQCGSEVILNRREIIALLKKDFLQEARSRNVPIVQYAVLSNDLHDFVDEWLTTPPEQMRSEVDNTDPCSSKKIKTEPIET